jgi:hypothetical protein
MRALFVGGVIDNNELDLEGGDPPKHYPPQTGSGQSRYRLHAVGHGNGGITCAVYGAPDLDPGEVQRISGERAYARRFGTELQTVG